MSRKFVTEVPEVRLPTTIKVEEGLAGGVDIIATRGNESIILGRIIEDGTLHLYQQERLRAIALGFKITPERRLQTINA